MGRTIADSAASLKRRLRSLEREHATCASERRALERERDRHLLENQALKLQLATFLLAKKRPRINDALRTFFVRLADTTAGWRSLLHVVQPQTVIRWHRLGFRYWWRWKSRSGGRPKTAAEVRKIIRKMAHSNPRWGAPRIHGELRKLDIRVSERTVSRLVPRPRSKPGLRAKRQRWSTFLRNHLPDLAACDFFTVPTAGFRILYVFVVRDLARRRIRHVNATEHPTQEWAAQQMVEAFPETVSKRRIIRDRDGIYGPFFRQRVRGLGLKEVLCSPRTPQQNAYAERVIGSIRRELLDHVIVLDERHLLRLLHEYVAYYNGRRTHLALNKDSPDGRPVHGPRRGRRVVEFAHVGGLHHHYERRAA